jgi:hypothetical protein
MLQGLFSLGDCRMSKFFEVCATICVIAIGIASVVGWGYGVYHAFNKHSIGFGVLNVIFPPLALYTVPEALFFHDDGIDWKTRIDNDVSTGILLINATMNPNLPLDKIEERNTASELYFAKLKEYPLDKKREVQRAIKIYKDLFISTHSDLMNYNKHIFKTATIMPLNLVFSSNTKKLIGKFEKYKSTFKGIIQVQLESNSNFIKKINNNFTQSKNKKNIKTNLEKIQKQISKVFSVIDIVHKRQKDLIDIFLEKFGATVKG